jgi:hypothetical protein
MASRARCTGGGLDGGVRDFGVLKDCNAYGAVVEGVFSVSSRIEPSVMRHHL